MKTRNEALSKLADELSAHSDWWLFPPEESVQGFMGDSEVFIVGDQPSKSKWLPDHPCRRAFYDTLKSVGLKNAHLTDLYKRKGECSEMKEGLPGDFQTHLEVFRKEIQILQPKLIVALGELAQLLLKKHLKEWQLPIPRIWHFSYVVRTGKQSTYAANMRQMIVMRD